MKFSLNILAWQGLAPGVNSFERWNQWANALDMKAFSGEIPKNEQIPMMAARRMSIGSRLAVDTGLSLLSEHNVDAVIFTSRHGELQKTERILHVLADAEVISPTDFSMSVHNTAAGWLTILSKNSLPVTSLAAGKDSFQQGLLEAQSLLATGYSHVMLVDFEGEIPAIYTESVNTEFVPYAVAILFTAGEGLACKYISATEDNETINVPQSLQFLRGYLSSNPSFYVSATGRHRWQWTRTL